MTVEQLLLWMAKNECSLSLMDDNLSKEVVMRLSCELNNGIFVASGSVLQSDIRNYNYRKSMSELLNTLIHKVRAELSK